MSRSRGAVMGDGNIVAWIGHGLSTTAILGTLAGLFPPIAALAAFIWYSVQLYESKTVQNWFARRRAHKIARLRARIRLLEQETEEKK